MSVAVLVPCRNGAAYLAEAIVSARDQTVAPAEVVVYDDASTDHSAALAGALGARVLSGTEPVGANAARNRLIEATDSEWVQFLDADDLLAPDKIECQLAGAGDADVVYSDVALIGATTGTICCPDDVTLMLLTGHGIHTMSMLVRRSALVLWDESFPVCTNAKFTFDLWREGRTFRRVPGVLSSYRTGWSPDQLTARHRDQAFLRHLLAGVFRS